MCFPCGPAYHFFGFPSVFHPCFIRGSRISCFATVGDECSIGGEGTSPSRRSAFPRQAQGSAAPMLFGLVDLGHRLSRQQGRHRTAQRTSGTDHRRRSAGRPQAVAGTGGTGSCSRIGGVRRLLRGTAFRSREQLGHGDHADNLPLDDQLNRLRLSQDRGGRVRASDPGPRAPKGRGGRTPQAGGRRR